MIEHMDTCIGQLLRSLARLQLERRTVVIFAGDNGGTASARNAPYSGIKGSTFEGGIRVPAIARWPGVIPAGTVSRQASITFDFTASIARLAGVTPAADQPLEGIDILEHVAQGKPDVERNLYWRKPRGDAVWKGMRQGSLKYVGHKQGDQDREYLFDLATDPGEKNDLKGERAGDFRRLKSLYERWEVTVRRHRRGRPESLSL
jgi:N-acetylgalactosamine-6-sulfatase